jgi:hypothetical protein
MSYLKQAAVITFILALASGANGQGAFRNSEPQVVQLLTRLDTHAEIGRYLKQFAWEFEQLTDRLKERSRERKPISSEVQEVLNRGPYLGTFMSSYDFGPKAERDWQLVYADLNQLASSYKLETYWSVPTSLGHPITVDLDALANRLIGTYKLDESQSDDLRDVVERAANELPQAVRRRVLTTLLIRLRVPERLAVERQRDKVTLASSLQPARTYTATGKADSARSKLEHVLLYGDQFRLSTQGEADSLYSVIYATIEQGARQHVTHTALLGQFARPLVIVSYYKKISDVPQLKLGADEPGGGSTSQSGARKNPR